MVGCIVAPVRCRTADPKVTSTLQDRSDSGTRAWRLAPPIRLVERLAEVLDQVGCALDPDREADQRLGDLEARAGHGGVGHHGRQLDQRLDAAQGLREREDPRRLADRDRAVARRSTALRGRHERDHPAAGAHLARGAGRPADGRAGRSRGPGRTATRRRRARPGSRRPPRRSGCAARPAAGACAGRAARGSSRTGRARAPAAFWRKRSRSATAGSRVTATPRIVSLWPARYFVAEWKTMSAPRSSGRWRTGVANVLSTTISGRGPSPKRSRSTPADGLDVDDLQERVRRRLEPDEPGAVGQRLPHRLRVGREVCVSGDDAVRAADLLEVAERAAVDVVADDDLGLRAGELGDRGGRRRARRERDPLPAALEGRDRALEPVARRVLRPGVVVVVDRPADAVLAVRRGLVDRRRDRAGQLVRLLAGVHGQRLDRQARVELVWSHDGMIADPAARLRLRGIVLLSTRKFRRD